LKSAAFPHSRMNDVPTRLLAECGYVVLVDSPGIGWTVAAREREGCLLMLLQGHPEYTPTALLREYRRDVRRFLDGSASCYPPIPDGYLDREGVAVLEAYRIHVEASECPNMDDFPFRAAAAHIAVDWQPDSKRLLCNWLTEAHVRATRAGSEPRVGRAISRRTSA
jgi:homoserine O-succinyltransferase